MWTPSAKQDESGFWFRLQYDTETARFEDISPILLDPTSSDALNGCKICKNFVKMSNSDFPQVTDDGFVLKDENYQVRQRANLFYFQSFDRLCEIIFILFYYCDFTFDGNYYIFNSKSVCV